MSLPSYCPRRVLRCISNGLLQDMLEMYEIELDVDWNEVTETKIEPVFVAWQALDEKPRRAIELLLREVHSMSDEQGQRVIFEEADRQGESELTSELSEYDSRYDVAMWTAITKPNIWETALLFARADRKLGGRYSQRRIDVPQSANPDGSPETMKALEKSISAFHSLRQGRGRRCQCEYLLRSDGTHFVVVTLDDYRKQYLKLVDGGGFEKACETPAFEIIIAYTPTAHTLDIDARGGKAVHGPLQTIVAREFLKVDLPPENPRDEPFTLGMLLDPKLRFPTDPADGITSVSVSAGRILVMGTKDRMTFEPGSHTEPTNFSDMVEAYINAKRLPRSVMKVERAVLSFEWEDADGKRRKFDVRITRPNRSNLKSLPQDERELAEKYLRLWGIDCAVHSDTAVAAA